MCLGQVLPFDQYADTGTVQKALQSCGSMSVARLVDRRVSMYLGVILVYVGVEYVTGSNVNFKDWRKY